MEEARLTVDLSAMPYINNEHHQSLVMDFVNDPVIANANSPGWTSGQLLYVRGPWIAR